MKDIPTDAQARVLAVLDSAEGVARFEGSGWGARLASACRAGLVDVAECGPGVQTLWRITDKGRDALRRYHQQKGDAE